MKTHFRQWSVAASLSLASIALATLSTSLPLHAQAFPTKPIRIIVPATPGGGTDIVSRLVAPKLTEQLGQSMIIENRAGAATNIGTEFVARAAPDGHTVLMATTPHAINPSLFRKLPFDPIRDFTMISQLGLTQNVVVVHPSLPVRNIREFIALAKARPGQLTAGTAGGTAAYLAVELLRTTARIDLLNIAYKGAGAALNDVVAGHVQFQVNTTTATLPFIQGGRLRAIATCGLKRTTSLPEVPTVAETIPGFESNGWYALLGPAGIPRDITYKLQGTFAKALRAPDVARRLSEMGVDIVAGSPEDLARLMPQEIAKWAVAVKASGAQPE